MVGNLEISGSPISTSQTLHIKSNVTSVLSNKCEINVIWVDIRKQMSRYRFFRLPWRKEEQHPPLVGWVIKFGEENWKIGSLNVNLVHWKLIV